MCTLSGPLSNARFLKWTAHAPDNRVLEVTQPNKTGLTVMLLTHFLFLRRTQRERIRAVSGVWMLK